MSMFDYNAKLIDKLPMGMEGTAKTQTDCHLFITNQDARSYKKTQHSYATT